MTGSNNVQPIALRCPQCGASLPHSTERYTICQFCGASLLWERPESQATSAEQAQVVRGIRLKEFIYTDTQGTGLELFRMLAPVDWELQGGCNWLLDNPGMPAAIAVQISNPQGAERFETLPNMNFTWNNNPLSRMLQPVGSRYFGAEVRPPMNIREAWRNLVLPRHRGAVQNLQIVSEQPQPDLPQLLRSEAAIMGGVAEGGKVRIRYDWQGASYEEEFYGLVEQIRAPLASLWGVSEVIFWFVDYLFCFRAAAGRLDATAKLFGAMISSFRLNPHWYAAYQSIVQYLAQQQIQQIHHIGQIGQIYAQTGREIMESNLNSWYARQDVYDRLATDRSRSILGVDAYHDPHRGEVVELPSGYRQAWANNLGEYILSEDTDYNPNIGSNLHWEPMQPQ